MTIEYISYIQTEKLFTQWPTLKAVKESLGLELKALGNGVDKEDENNLIYTQVIGNKVLTDTPPSGNISDTTASTSASYQQVAEREYNATLEQILKEKSSINLVDCKLDLAFRRLTPLQQDILKLFYWEGQTWAEVLEEIKKTHGFTTKQQAQRQRRDSLEKIQITSKVNVETYLFVMDLVGVE